MILLALLAQLLLPPAPDSPLGGQILAPEWVQPGSGSRAPFVNVKAWPFYAKCDGSQDDSGAIQAALTGKNVLVPAGTCSLGTTGITIPQAAQLLASGPEQTAFTYSGSGCGITVDSVTGTVLEGFRLTTSGSGANVRGLCYSNTTGPNLRKVARNVQVWSTQNPPVIGQYGVYLHSTTSNSLYYTEFDHVDANLWEKCFYSLGDIGFGGVNANKWFAPEANACTVGMDFQGVAGANTALALHCNGAGVAIDQNCVNIGDGVNNSSGNFIELYADNSVSGHIGKSYSIAAASLRNTIHSFTSGNTLGTNGNAGSVDKNVVVEMNAASSRVTLNVGNIVFTADTTNPSVVLQPSSGNAGLFQCNSTNVSNAIVCRTRANLTMTQAGAVMWEIFNGARVSAIDLNGAYQMTGQTFANLGAPATPPNGTIQYCTDCTIANPCAGGGTGAMAKRLNGVWVCN